MVDHLQNLCLIQTVYRLCHFIMIHQHQTLFAGPQQTSSGDHTIITAVEIHNREITISFFGHGLPDIIHIIIALKCDQRLLFHEITDWHTLIDQSCCRVGVIWRLDDKTALALRQLFDRKGYQRTITHNNTFCPHLNGTKLGFITVT